MSRIVVRSEAEQDAILLLLYGMARHHAANLLRRSCRDDVVQDLALLWLEALRDGTFDVPGGDPETFAFEAVLARATVSAKRQGVIAEEFRPAAQVSTPSAGARVATGNECEATVHVHTPVRRDYESQRAVRRPTRQDLETIRDECEAIVDDRESSADECESSAGDCESSVDDCESSADDCERFDDDREAFVDDFEPFGDESEALVGEREAAGGDREAFVNERGATEDNFEAFANVLALTGDDREAARSDRK